MEANRHRRRPRVALLRSRSRGTGDHDGLERAITMAWTKGSRCLECAARFRPARETGPSQLAHEALIDRWLKLEIQIVERFYRREVRDLQRHGDAGPLLRVDLLAQHAVERIETRRLGASGLVRTT